MRIIRFIFILLLISVVALQIINLISAGRNSRIVQVCPTGAISMRASKAVIDSSKCIGCQRCVIGLPVLVHKTSDSSQPIIEVPVPQQALRPEKPDGVEQNIEKQVKPVRSTPVTKQETLTKKPADKAYSVIPENCIGCKLCVPNCPTNAISMIDGKAVIDKEKCISCGICVNGNGADFAGCPVRAIKAPQASQESR